jgi:hypothetical protein
MINLICNSNKLQLNNLSTSKEDWLNATKIYIENKIKEFSILTSEFFEFNISNINNESINEVEIYIKSIKKLQTLEKNIDVIEKDKIIILDKFYIYLNLYQCINLVLEKCFPEFEKFGKLTKFLFDFDIIENMNKTINMEIFDQVKHIFIHNDLSGLVWLITLKDFLTPEQSYDIKKTLLKICPFIENVNDFIKKSGNLGPPEDFDDIEKMLNVEKKYENFFLFEILEESIKTNSNIHIK